MKGLILILFLFISSISSATKDDSTSVKNDTIHSIKKAVILSSILPGAGQIYNHIAMPKGKKKAFWKLPLIYAGLGGTTYFLIHNQIEQNKYKEEYRLRQNSIVSPEYDQYTDSGILTLYNQHLNRRDLSILGVVAVYFIQIIDAGVESHFVSFDISEDLSMTIEPTILNYKTPGLKMSFNFR